MNRRQLAMIGLLILVLAYPAMGFAFVIRSGDMIIIGGNEIIDEDLFLAGNEIIINGTVHGNLYAAGKVIAVNGTVRGDATLAGNRIDVSGTVGGSVRALSDTLTVHGMVENDLVCAVREVTVNSTLVKGNLLTGAMNIVLGGPVNGYALIGARSVMIDSTIGSDVAIGAHSIVLTENVIIGGDLAYYSANEARIDPGAVIFGTLRRSVPETRFDIRTIFPFMAVAGVIGRIATFFMGIVVGLVLLLLVPEWIDLFAESMRKKPAACAGWGALLLFVAPLGMVIGFVTIIGFMLGAIALLTYLIAVYIGQIAAGLLIGRMILGRFEIQETFPARFGIFALGYFIIRLFRFIPIAGYLIFITTALFGLGSIFVTILEKKSVKRETAGG